MASGECRVCGRTGRLTGQSRGAQDFATQKTRRDRRSQFKDRVQESKAGAKAPGLVFLSVAALTSGAPPVSPSAQPALISAMKSPSRRSAIASRAPGHQVLVIGEIDRRQRHHREDLARLDEMTPVGARIVARGRRRRQRRSIGRGSSAKRALRRLMPAAPGEDHAVAAGPRRHHAVEHVDAARQRSRADRRACRRP